MKRATAFRLSDEARTLLEKLAKNNGISQAAVLEMAIRKEARLQDVTLDELPPKKRLPKGEPMKMS